MVGRRSVLQGAGALAGLAALGAPRKVKAMETIKIGSVAPWASPWGVVFSTWAKAVEQKSGGALALQIFFNATQGDEAAMVAKTKSGQLDGVIVSGVGLGKIYKPILALQMPGLFSVWSKLDAVRDAMKPGFEQGARDAGFTISGWYDVGLTRLMTRGYATRAPADLRGKKPWAWREDPLASALFQTIGVTPVPLSLPEVLPNLNTGALDGLFAGTLFAEQLRWIDKLDSLVDMVCGVSVGAVAFSSTRLNALPADLRQIVLDTGKVAMASLTNRIRNEDAAAFIRQKARMAVTTLTADEQAAWTAVFKQTRQRLAQGTFAPELVAQLELLAGV